MERTDFDAHILLKASRAVANVVRATGAMLRLIKRVRAESLISFSAMERPQILRVELLRQSPACR